MNKTARSTFFQMTRAICIKIVSDTIGIGKTSARQLSSTGSSRKYPNNLIIPACSTLFVNSVEEFIDLRRSWATLSARTLELFDNYFKFAGKFGNV